MATKYSNYTKTDPNPDGIIDAIDMDGKGLIRLSLTEWSNTAKPNVAQESIVENGGARFKTDTVGGDVISLTDPTTGVTVVDGPVYIVLNGDSVSGGYGSYAFTATEPIWSDEKQGYYLTGLYSDYRAVGGCQLASGIYTEKYVWVHRDQKALSPTFGEYTEYIPTEKSTTSGVPEDITPTFAGALNVERGDIIEVFIKVEVKTTSGLVFYSFSNIGTCIFSSYRNSSSYINSYLVDGPFLSFSLFSGYSENYIEGLYSRKIYIKSSGTLKIKEQFYVQSGTGYVKNRAVYLKKINNIKVGI